VRNSSMCRGSYPGREAATRREGGPERPREPQLALAQLQRLAHLAQASQEAIDVGF
jgi:hypothetical protein